MSRRVERLPKVSFRPGQEAQARAFLETPPRSKATAARESAGVRNACALILTALPLVFVAVIRPHSPADVHENAAFLPVAVLFGCLVVIVVVSHFTTAHFVLDPLHARVVSDEQEIPFSELGVPRIIGTRHLVSGSEYLHEVKKNVLESGKHSFFNDGALSHRRLSTIANALNDAIREHDERLAVRQWLERRGASDE